MPIELVQRADSASANYQQYVQSMSDSKDVIDAFTSAQLSWASALIEVQKSWLDLCQGWLAGAPAGALLQQMSDAGARLVLLAGKAA